MNSTGRLDRHYTDPRLAELYDLENPLGPDAEFYTSLAAELGVSTIVDLGCGTGLITVELANDGRQVIGVDPAEAMLARARTRAGGERVRWIHGDSGHLGSPSADLAIMTGNVAQVFLDDCAWEKSLGDIHRALRPGGYLAFESRNPEDRAWERWTPDSTLIRLQSSGGPVRTWLEVVEVLPGRVVFEGHNFFETTGEDIVSRSELRFRNKEEISDSLVNAGFVIDAIFGNWDRRPFAQDSRLMVFVVRR